MSSFFSNANSKSNSMPLAEKSNSFFNRPKASNFFNNSKENSTAGVNKNQNSGRGQKNSFFGGNSGNKKASTWFANTSLNPSQLSQKDAQNGSGSTTKPQNQSKSNLNFSQVTPSQKKVYNPKDWSLDDFEIGKPIGRGGFGKVYLARTKKDHFICAIKVVNKTKLSKDYGHLIAREIEIQRLLNHKNILKLFAFFWDEKNIYMVTEYAPDGDLFCKLLQQKGKKFNEMKAAYYIYQICNAFQYLHSLNILHRDLKPENILVSDDDLKLCDFGWAAYVSNCSRRTYCGTTDYLSPELLNDEKYGKEVDVWSIGVLAYELCTGKAPFASKQDKDTRKKITKLDFSIPSNFSRELRDFVEGILKKNPEKRPTIEEVLNHRWLKMNVSAYRESQKQKPQNLSYFN